MSSGLFISYGHIDMRSVNWLERLKLYLAPLRRQERVDIWDDTRIKPGVPWQTAISDAIDNSTSAILLVGPGFLASDFIINDEVPKLLERIPARGGHIYPVIIGYSSYKQSALGKYQAFNNPDQPLEAITAAEQNRILNSVSLKVDEDLRQAQPASLLTGKLAADTTHAMAEILNALESTHAAFVAQARRRDLLVAQIKGRLKVRETLQYENFFFRYFGVLDKEEKFQFDQIRAMTEGPLHDGNQRMLTMMEQHPRCLEEVSQLTDLRQHLVFWLNKYDRVFTKKPEMCLLYTGVEDGVPFPNGIDRTVKSWIEKKG